MAYKANVYKGAKSFTFDGKTYAGGDQFESTDACEIKSFIQAYQAVNSAAGVREESPNVKTELDEACPTGAASSPASASASQPVEENPGLDGDSGSAQGAPSITDTVGVEVDPEKDRATPPAPGEEPTRPPEGEKSATHNRSRSQTTSTAGDPVDLFNGALYLQETDVVIPNTIMPLRFVRSYRSGAASYGPLGWNWDHNYNLYLRELKNGDVALWRSLHEDTYHFDGASFQPPRGIFEVLGRVGGLSQAYEITIEGGTVMRFERPSSWLDGERIPLLQVEDRHGNKLKLTYGAEDRLNEVRDDDDRFLQFAYDTCGLLMTVSDQSGRKYFYEHDEQCRQLTCVTFPATMDQPKGATKVYHYERPFALPELRHNLLRIEDAEGRIYVENEYEQDPASLSFARLKTQLYGSYLYQFQYTHLQWVPEGEPFMNTPSLRVEVMNPDFGLETYTFNNRGDLLDRRFRLSLDGSFRVVAHQFDYDQQGNVSTITFPDGSQELRTYDAANADPRRRGLLLQRELSSASGFPAPSRVVWRGQYEPKYLLLTEETDESLKKTRYKYDFDLTPAAIGNSGRLMQVIPPQVTLQNGATQSSVTKFEVNGRGQVLAVISPEGERHELSYGTSGNERARLVQLLYDANGLAITSQIGYDFIGFEETKVDGNGNTTKRSFNSWGLLEKEVLPAVDGTSAESIMHYDSDRHLVQEEQPKGQLIDLSLADDHVVNTMRLDVLGYPEELRLAENTSQARTYAFRCDHRGRPVMITNPDRSRIVRLFDERGLLLREEVHGEDGARSITHSAYDRAGKLASTIDSSGLTTHYEYDGFSRLQKVVRGNGSELHYKWLAGDRLASEEIVGDDGSGNIRQLVHREFAYDEKGRKTSETEMSFRDDPHSSLPLTKRFVHDSCDRVVTTIDHRGAVVSHLYDGLGRLSRTFDPVGNEEHRSYDRNGNLTRTESHHREPNGSFNIIVKRHSYDSRDRRIASSEPDGSSTQFSFDDRDLIIRRTDRMGVVVEFGCDAFGNRTSEKRDVGGTNASQAWAFDNMSRLTAYTDPTGEVSNYQLDGIGRPLRMEYPNGFSSTKKYGASGLLEKEELGSGIIFEFEYDAANRLRLIKNPVAPAPIIPLSPQEYSYDGLDRVVSSKAGSRIVRRRYDSKNRLLAEESNGNSISCVYDDLTGAVEKEWPDGRKEKLSHDLNGTLIEVEEIIHSTFGAGAGIIASFKPSGLQWLGEARYQHGLKIVNAFDERKRLVQSSVTSSTGLNETLRYRYDRCDRLRVEALAGAQIQINLFTFDNLERLLNSKDGFVSSIPDAHTQAEHDSAIAAVALAASASIHGEQFLYDTADARLNFSETGAPGRAYTYLPGHRIQTDGLNIYQHTVDGTLSSDGSFEYDVDALGRVVSVKRAAVVVCRLAYDAFWRPGVVEELGKPSKTFNYLGAFVEQENIAGSPSRHITVNPMTGVPLAYHDTTDTFYPLFDARYNLLGLADSSGQVIESYSYKVFGIPRIFDGTGNPIATSAFDSTPIFGGQKYLGSAALYLSTRRLLDPANGLFLSGDARGYIDSPSLYVYGRQDPVNNIDPEGDVVPLIIAVFVIGGALIGAGYSIYDAAENPNKYGGWGALRPLGNVFGGAAVGGASVAAGEYVLAAGGVGIYGSGTGAALTLPQAFALYGSSSVVSGAIGRGGFHELFPEYIDPVTARSVGVDFVGGGALGTGFRAMANLTAQTGFGTFPSVPGTGKFGQWLRFGADLGGEAPETGNLGAYPGDVGAILDKVGIRQGNASTVINHDIGGSWFSATDTAAHEGFHAFTARYFPTFRQLSGLNRLGAIARYPEEVIAYSIGHTAAGRVHGLPFAPFEAFNSLQGFEHVVPGSIKAAKIVWGRLAGTGGVWASEQLFPSGGRPSSEAQPPKK
jgi:RHS repeat-associated protein